MKLKAVTITTQYDDRTKCLEKSAQNMGINFTTIIKPQSEWWSYHFCSKVTMLYDYLCENIFSEDDIILFTDAHASLFIAGEGEILKKYEEFNASVVISAEAELYPNVPFLKSNLPENIFYFKYLNSGGFMGGVNELKKIFKDMIKTTKGGNFDVAETDQSLWQEYFLRNSRDIALDHNCLIFQNFTKRVKKIEFINKRIKNTITDSYPCVLHGNGGYTEILDCYFANNDIDMDFYYSKAFRMLQKYKDKGGGGLNRYMVFERYFYEHCKRNDRFDILKKVIWGFLSEMRDNYDNKVFIMDVLKNLGSNISFQNEHNKHRIDWSDDKDKFMFYELDYCFSKKELQSTIFGSGDGDIPIPYGLPDNVFMIEDVPKDNLCSFIGWVAEAGPPTNTKIRFKMKDLFLEEEGFQIMDLHVTKRLPMHEYFKEMSRSIFCLCPRGASYTSFRIYEAIALGVIPIYIWDNIEWLPYKEELNWDEFSISVHEDDMHKIPEIIKNFSDEEIKQMQKRLKEVWRDYFCRDAMCKKIIEYIDSKAKRLNASNSIKTRFEYYCEKYTDITYNTKNINFVQIGENGADYHSITDDNENRWGRNENIIDGNAKKYGWTGVIIEPNIKVLNILKKCYEDDSSITFINGCLSMDTKKQHLLTYNNNNNEHQYVNDIGNFEIFFRDTVNISNINVSTIDAISIDDVIREYCDKDNLIISINSGGYKYEFLNSLFQNNIYPIIIQTTGADALLLKNSYKIVPFDGEHVFAYYVG